MMGFKDLLQKTDVPEGRTENWAIGRFTVSEDASSMDRLQGLFGGTGRYTPPGDYTRLCRISEKRSFNNVVMSDTPDELRDHWSPVLEAHGHCLVHGLGLGIVAEACLRKEDVSKVTVIELESEVIGLVAPYLREKWGDRIEIIEANCLEWKPPKGVRYGMVWHDIWDSMCEDNLGDMHKLHRRYGRRTDWQGSWGRWWCERQRRESRSYGW